jgi:hypothetical protein
LYFSATQEIIRYFGFGFMSLSPPISV